MSNDIQEKKLRARSVTTIIAAVILAGGLGYGMSLVGNGLSAKAGNSITVTGSAKTSATADNVVWTLNVQESSPSVATAVKKVEKSVVSLKDYLTSGGVDAAGIETAGISSFAINEYINGNQTGRVLSYQASQNVTVRSKDVAKIKELSGGIGSLLQSGVNVNN